MTEIYMPKNGMDMTEGTLIRWLKNEGDYVKAGDPIMEIETDKVSMEAEAPASGIILRQLYQEGAVVPVLTTIGYIGEQGDIVPENLPMEKTVPAAISEEALVQTRTSAPLPQHTQNGEIAATPLAKTLAQKYGVDLRAVSPSGQMGEIRGGDVEKASQNRPAATPLAATISRKLGISLTGMRGSGFGGKVTKADVLSAQAAAHPAIPAEEGEKSRNSIPMTSMRRVIARRMSSSHTEIPSVTSCVKVDVTRLLALRGEINADREREDRISINDFILKAAGKALMENERFRMSIDGNSYILHDQINIGVAVGMDEGLLVPVVRDVDKKSLLELSHTVKRLAGIARGGSLTPENLGGACITISNLGMYGTYYFTPIINQPEAAIIGVCSVEDELALVDGQVAVRKKTLLCMTYDHRIINGTEASKFQADLKQLLENPTDILI